MKKIKGTKIQEGITYGRVFKIKESMDIVGNIRAKNIPGEIKLFQQGLLEYQNDLEKLIKKRRTKDEEEILKSHLLLSRDESLISEIEEKIKSGFTAIYSTNLVFSNYIDILNANTKLEDSRSTDFLDIKRGIINKIIKEEKIDFPKENFILVLDETFPSIISKYRTKYLKGVITKKGGEMSHAAIILKSLLIPYISAVDTTKLDDNELIILDATNGIVIKDPNKKDILKLKKEKRETKQVESSDCYFKSGEKANLMIDLFNINQFKYQKEIPPVGLYRSEIFFISQKRTPTKLKQEKIYYEILKKAHPNQVVIRLLDLSVDKKLPYLNEILSQDDIGIRVIHKRPNLFKTQIEALISAYSKFSKGELYILIPMVSERTEVLMVRDLIIKTRNKINPELDLNKINIGMMVEIPITCFEVEKYLDLIDFISIGTNDLIKYVFSISRNNETYNYDLSYFNLAFLSLLNDIKEKSEKENVVLYVCGGMPTNFYATLTLLAMGFKNLTISQGTRNLFKKRIAKIDYPKLKDTFNNYLKDKDLNNYLKNLKDLTKKGS